MWDNWFLGPIDYSREPISFLSFYHILTLIIVALLITFFVLILRKKRKKTLIWIIRGISIYVFVTEIMKIGWYHHYEWFSFSAWLPLFYCSLFIYASIMVSVEKGLIRDLGYAYIVSGGIIGGLFYLLIPCTDNMYFPIYHFMGFHSTSYHTLMLFTGILVLASGLYKPNIKNYWKSLVFISFFMFIALFVNLAVTENIMVIMSPGTYPFDLLDRIYNTSHVLYTVLAMSVQIFLPHFFGMFLNLFIKRKKFK